MTIDDFVEKLKTDPTRLSKLGKAVEDFFRSTDLSSRDKKLVLHLIADSTNFADMPRAGAALGICGIGPAGCQ